MIKSKDAILIVKNYLDKNKIDYLRMSVRVLTQKKEIPYGVMEGKVLTVHTVCYDYEGYYGDDHGFITVNAEDGALLFGTSSTRYYDLEQ
ncbi:hypothetical protein V1389_07835 [Flavobacterium rakeshii]|uniref:hypothetical protein n=1 Tax=Flavobacterium rakeshii TaxID=1038845 RepID=UPI002E7AE821|nr:hypothetical protein [Flavobacterium rakeshii]MEE1898240.1 hypothetical protein [Flavobacterium rakeshii]